MYSVLQAVTLKFVPFDERLIFGSQRKGMRDLFQIDYVAPVRMIAVLMILAFFQVSILGQTDSMMAAKEKSAKAAKIFSEAQDLFGQGSTESFRAALQKFRSVGEVFAQIGDKNRQAESMVYVGMIEDRLGDRTEARKAYEAALRLSRDAGHKFSEAIALGNLGLIYFSSGEQKKGIEYYEKAAPLFRAVGNEAKEALVHSDIGIAYQSLGETKKALESFSTAIALFRSLGDKRQEAITFNSIGLIYLELGDSQKALESFNKALPLARVIGDKAQESVCLFNIGGTYEKAGDIRKAITFYDQALSIFHEIGDQFKQAFALSSIGFGYSSLGEREKALDHYSKALTLNRKTDNKSAEGTTLHRIGTIYDLNGQLPKALEYQEAALLVFQGLGSRPDQANVLVTIGQLLDKVGDRNGALNAYFKALPIYRELRDREGEAQTIAGIGLIYQILGQMTKAEDLYAESLAICQSSGDKSGEAAMLMAFGFFLHSTSNFAKAGENFTRAAQLCGAEDQMCAASTQIGLGAAYKEQAEYQKAIDSYNRAISLSHLISFEEGEILGLNALGQVYFYLGLNQRALDTFRQALKVSESIGRKDSEALSLGNIGQAYFGMEDYEKALDFQKRALSIIQLTGNKQLETIGLNNIGLTLVEMKRPKEGLGYFEKSLIISTATGNKLGQATNLLNLGYAYSEMRDYDRAMANLKQALYLSRIVGDITNEAEVLGTIALSLYEQKKLRYAAFYGKHALNIIQSVRTKLSGFDSETRRAFIKRFEKGYRKLADLFVEMGRFAEAERVLAMLKEDEYFDYVRRDDKVADELTAKMSLTPDEQKAFDEYKKYADGLTTLGKEFGQLQAESKQYEVGKFPKQKRLDELEKLIANANKVFNSFLDDLKVKFGENDRRVAGVESGSQVFLKELGQPKTVMISTIASEDRLNLIVTTADAQRAHTVDIKAADLNKLVFEFRADVKNPRIDPRIAGKKVYDTLFPVSLQKDLEGIKADTIVWSLDGTLRYVPISALWDGKQYLVEKYRNVLITLASRGSLANARTDRTKWQALGVGVSKQATLKGSDGTSRDFEALTAVPHELCSVIADPEQNCSAFATGRKGVIAGKTLLDERFTLSSFKSNLGRYPVVHIASHFSLNAGNENDSYLLLGGGAERKLTLADVRQGGAKFLGVELLTLSACNTAMSTGNRSNGIEVEGFGALAQNQGAKSVLASLWSVADVSTRDLMIEFYKQLEATPGISKAEALQKAQLSLLNGKYAAGETVPWRNNIDGALKKFQPDANAPFAHPYYWSPFILMGNWQ